MRAEPRRLKHCGWGYEDEQPPLDKLRGTAAFLADHLGFGDAEPGRPVPLGTIDLPPPRLRAPDRLVGICRKDAHTRTLHAYGRSYRDVVRALTAGSSIRRISLLMPAPRPSAPRCWTGRSAPEPQSSRSAAGRALSAVSSRRSPGDGFTGVVTIDLKGLDRVLEVDPTSQSARIQAGATGPALEEQLGEHDLTLRRFPQSFAFATLGGMIATRAKGISRRCTRTSTTWSRR